VKRKYVKKNLNKNNKMFNNVKEILDKKVGRILRIMRDVKKKQQKLQRPKKEID
jgi:hypothetical protein